MMLLPSFISAEILLKESMYGFNYMRPESAECKSINQLDLNIKNCEWAVGNGFDGDSVSYFCIVEKFQQYIVFENQAECLEQLETMHANAP